jgi:DNA polymerase III epsilon subunit-like protein
LADTDGSTQGCFAKTKKRGADPQQQRRDMDYIAIDTETGGLDAAECALLSVAAVTSWGTRPFYRRCVPAPGLRVEDQAAQVNGYDAVRWKEDAEVTTEKVLAFEWLYWLNEVLGGRSRQNVQMVAHNAGFDALFLLALEGRTGIDLEMPKTWVCTKIRLQGLRERGLLPTEGGNHLDDLGDLSGYWKEHPRSAAHDALEDAKACMHGLQWMLGLEAEKERGAAV